MWSVSRAGSASSPWTTPWLWRRQGLSPAKRHASLTSAVERGKRRSNSAADRSFDSSGGRNDQRPSIDRPLSANADREPRASRHGELLGESKSRPQREIIRQSASHTPISIPYTTPASQFLYGTFAIQAALKARRRKFYKLYVLQGDDAQLDRAAEIESLARSARVRVQQVGQDWARILNKMAEGRPHNGYVLEASPLPRLPIRALEELESVSDPIRVRLDNVSEEEREIAGESSIVPRKVRAERYPLVLLLDRILDPGNLGGIIRSAYFLGVDALALTRSGTAPMSAVTIKASAGAAEAMPILTANSPMDFLKKSRANGWQIFAAVSPSSESGQLRKDRFVSPWNSLADGPCILVIGGEGEGIARSIMREISGYVGVSQTYRDDGLDIVESLNVSVASALMIRQFLEKQSQETGDTKSPGVLD